MYIQHIVFLMLSKVKYDFNADGRGDLTAGNIGHFYCLLGIGSPREFFLETKNSETGKNVKLDNLSVISFIRNNRRSIPHPFESAFADRMERRDVAEDFMSTYRSGGGRD